MRLGGPKTDNMYHAGWAWAGSTPYKSHQARRRSLRWHPPADGGIVAQGHQGGRRRRALSSITSSISCRPFTNSTKITPPQHGQRVRQDSLDGVSMVYTFADAKAEGQRKTQFFDIMASRGIYHDGWFACALGPREPWVGGIPKGIKEWSPAEGPWELYNIDEDWSQANDLAAKMPKKLEQMKALFLIESTKNKNLPIGGGLWSTVMFHPEDAPASSLTEWTFTAPMTRHAGNVRAQARKVDSLVTMEVDVPANANGVLYALAAFSGGVTCYVKDGVLNYEFNLFEVQRTKIKAKDKLPDRQGED